MERRIENSLVKLIWCVLVSLLMVMGYVGAASSRPTRINSKFNYYGEQLRRNLLANGLGMTPPMGYVMLRHFLLSFLQMLDVSVSSLGCWFDGLSLNRMLMIRSQ